MALVSLQSPNTNAGEQTLSALCLPELPAPFSHTVSLPVPGLSLPLTQRSGFILILIKTRNFLSICLFCFVSLFYRILGPSTVTHICSLSNRKEEAADRQSEVSLSNTANPG